MPRHSNKLYGDRDIERHCNQALKDKDYSGRTSIATQSHQHSREIARNRRRRERQEEKANA